MATVEANLCLMLYQMADNDLEYFIRQDNYELSISPVIRTSTMTTWIYFDHRNYLGTYEDITKPLPNVFESDGSPQSGQKPMESQYIRWDHSLGKLVIDRTLPGEQDGDDPATLTQFLVTAMEDCVAKGSTEFFLIMASHGGGFAGLGGDEHVRRWMRHLMQSNLSVASGIKAALSQVAGAPERLDILGFDACLMQAVGAADDYQHVADYMLASEAVEPGHGWAYDILRSGGSALELARDILSGFLRSTHGERFHSTPKTLSILDLAKFGVFLEKWNYLSAELRGLIQSKDAELSTQLNRARNQAIAFESVVDDVGTNRPSALDVGSFLELFSRGCIPFSGSNLAFLLHEVQVAYDDMFVERDVGEGTPAATGVHILWPVRREYAAYKPFYDDRLFNTDLPYAMASAPDWLTFLQTFYNTPSSSTSDRTASVCTRGSSGVAPESGRLLIGPRLSGIQNGGHAFSTQVSSSVDGVFVEFGIRHNLQFLNSRRLHVKDNFHHDDNHLVQPSTMSSRKGEALARQTRRPSTDSQRRRLQQSGKDYLLVFGGTLLGNYDQASFSALWHRKFYSFQDSAGDYHSFFAFENGGASRSIPVIYMPPNTPITNEALANTPLGMTEVDFIAMHGGQIGALTFPSDGSTGLINDALTLFTYSGASLGETPRTRGGQIIPVQYVEGNIGGTSFSVIVGGLAATVLDWNSDFSIDVVDATTFSQHPTVDALVFDVLASDDALVLEGDVAKGIDFVTFEIASDGSTKLVTYSNRNSSSGSKAGIYKHHYAIIFLIFSITWSLIRALG